MISSKEIKRPAVINFNKLVLILVSILISIIVLQSLTQFSLYFQRYGKQTKVYISTKNIEVGQKITSENTKEVYVPKSQLKVDDVEIGKISKGFIMKNTIITNDLFSNRVDKMSRTLFVPVENNHFLNTGDFVDLYTYDVDGVVSLVKNVLVQSKLQSNLEKGIVIKVDKNELPDLLSALLTHTPIMISAHS